MNPGDRIGRYEILGLLGQGGMGQVFRAYDGVLHRQVAIKLLRTDLGDASGADPASYVRRALREARHAAALTHPNVVALYDVGEHEGTPFLVMELVSGRPLRSYVGSNVDVATRLRWLLDVARALAAAHRTGLVHQDIKPENVLVNDDGVAKVLDFGIARSVGTPGEAADPFARAGAGTTTGGSQGRSLLAGTPGYMAPEVITGRPTDARVDQFAWGVMAYELLSGRSPWGDVGPSMTHALLHDEPPLLDASAMGLSADVVAAVARAMRKSPDARFATMDALIAAIGGTPRVDAEPLVLAESAALAPTPGSVAGTLPAVDTRPRRRLAWIAAGALVVAAVASGALYLRDASSARSGGATGAASSRAGHLDCKPCVFASATLDNCCVQ
jgi:eukaryotic-like serine/threonine-protein kinase